MAWRGDVPHVEIRESWPPGAPRPGRSGAAVRVPRRPCGACTAAAAGKMADALLDVMTDAGVPPGRLGALLDWLARRAR